MSVILVLAPSSILMSMATRLRANRVTSGVICTDCLPRLMYSCFRPATAWLSVAWLNDCDCPKPKELKFCRITLLCSIFAPVMLMLLMVGRSTTVSNTWSPKVSTRTSSKKPVA